MEWTLAPFSVGSETYFIGVARNLTDRKSADEKRMEAERLNTLLEIAGGAAHETNQEQPPQIADTSLRVNEILKRMQAVSGIPDPALCRRT